jgi:adenine-specific DNA-methyltransferase
MRYELLGHNPTTGQWRWEKNRTKKAMKNYEEFLQVHSENMSLDEWFVDSLTSNNVKLDFVRASEEGTVQYYVPPSGQKLLSDNWMDILLSGSETSFETEKNKNIVRRMVEWLTGADDIFLDSFAGSGTSAHAVIEANVADGLNRRFLLIEMESKVSDNVIIPRLKKAIGEDAQCKSGFRFCTLGEPLFDADGNVSPAVTFQDLAAHVFFCETGSPIPRRAEVGSSLIGTFQGRVIYLLHCAEAVGVASAKAGNVLTGSVLDTLPKPAADFAGNRIVYGEGCTVPEERLSQLGVTFKQIPYQIEGL